MNEYTPETLGAVIKAARVEGMALTRREFAERVGVTQEAVYAWDKDWRTPGGRLFVRLLELVPPPFAVRLLRAAGMHSPVSLLIPMCDGAGNRRVGDPIRHVVLHYDDDIDEVMDNDG